MLHHAPLVMTIGVGLVAAFVLGFAAQKARLSPIVGYLAAGLMIGPYTPGYVGDVDLATQLSEIGVILLMFGVGLHFSFRELLAVRKVALPGAIAQMTVATALGTGLGLALGWSLDASLLFGLALSVASTVVMLRALEERQLLDTRAGHIAVGWLIVEDLAMVLALVVVPVLATDGATAGAVAGELAWTLVKVGGFAAIMLIVGTRAIPWLLARVADAGSRELFTLAVLAIGLGVAVGAAQLFGVSLALGAFFAGMVLRESELSHRAAEDSLPLRDAFAVLFFVSVGMLVDPRIVLERPLALVATVAVIILGKGIVAFALVRAMRYSRSMALVVAASLAQIGEFSFILVTLGADLDVLPGEAQDLVLAAAILSIIVNPLLFVVVERATRKRHGGERPLTAEARGHVIVVGHGRVGRRAARGLRDGGVDVVVVDDDERRVEAVRESGHEAILGNGSRDGVLTAAGIATARAVLISVPDPLNAGAIAATARALAPRVAILARGHGRRDIEYLTEQGASRVVVGVHEAADLMVRLASDGDARGS
ncbi:YbaL family putative K(+) efflux transporter [Demequina pelophila]|uniref:YbaL family putative K(+) efflux transporter n=1 Tax=Demequina pelophila TaxID=1638984 RepID=UPI0007858FB1|nr:YbaL family putative K(+) efflux transporter [Demequina pelophila]